MRGTGRGPRLARLALVALLLGVTVVGDTPMESRRPRDTLTVLGHWTGAELAAFRRLLRPFEKEHDVRVEVQGTTATRELLLSAVQSGNPPDVAVLPALGELVEYARDRRLRELPDRAHEREADYGDFWLPRREGAARYWLPVKIDLKSIVWYRRGERPSGPVTDPARWCLGMGSDATTGWPGTDWIEDLVLQRSGAGLYTRWATGRLPWTDPAIVDAWWDWGTLMNGDGTGAAASRALVTDHRGPADGDGLLFSPPGCDVEHQGGFALAFYGERRAEADFVPSTEALLLSGTPDGHRYREVSADFAAMFGESEKAALLVEYLASVGQVDWARMAQAPDDPGGAREAEDARSDAVRRRIVTEMRTADQLCLDASDLMPPTLRRVFYEKVLEFLSDPGQDPRPLLEEVEDVRRELESVARPSDTPWMPNVCGAPRPAPHGTGRS